MTVLVTGAADFIGSHVATRLPERRNQVFGFDNLNDCHDVVLKRTRLVRFEKSLGYTHIAADLADRAVIEVAFVVPQPDRVVHLAAQAGVRYAELKLPKQCLGCKAKVEMLPLQAGDVFDTEADVSDLIVHVDYRPKVGVEQGVTRSVTWCRQYYGT